MLNVDGTRGAKGKAMELEWNNMIRKAKKTLKSEDRDRALYAIQNLMMTEGNVPTTAESDYRTCNPAFGVTVTKYRFVRHLRALIHPHMIRRTIESKTWEGRPINELKPKQIINYLVHLPESEMDLLREDLDKLSRESKPTFNYDFEVRYSVIMHNALRAAWQFLLNLLSV